MASVEPLACRYGPFPVAKAERMGATHVPPRFGVIDALAHAQQGRLEEWVHAFLTTDGCNVPFSQGLKKRKRVWAGPAVVKVARLRRSCGPELEMAFVTPPASWDAHVRKLQRLIRQAWEMPPLLVECRHGDLIVRDGNHRHEALSREGIEECPVIFWGSAPGDIAEWAPLQTTGDGGGEPRASTGRPLL